MSDKAQVIINRKREVRDRIIIEADIKIKGISKKKTFNLKKDLKEEEIKMEIEKEIKAEQTKSVIGQSFEVEI